MSEFSRDVLPIPDRRRAGLVTFDARDLRLHGRARLAQGRDEEALLSFEYALRFKPPDGGILAYQGLALDGLGRIEEALDAYTRALALTPDNVAVWERRRDVLIALGRPEEADECLARIRALTGN